MNNITQKTKDLKLYDEEEQAQKQKECEELKARVLTEEDEEEQGLAQFKLVCQNHREAMSRRNSGDIRAFIRGPCFDYEGSAFDNLTSAFLTCGLPTKASHLSRMIGGYRNSGETVGWYVWWLEGPLANYKVRLLLSDFEKSGYRVEIEESLSERSKLFHSVATIEEAFGILSELLRRIKTGTARENELVTLVMSARSKAKENSMDVVE